MQLLNKDGDALLRKAISGCHKAQNYSKPLIDKARFEKGVLCEQKLSALINLASEKPDCGELRTELENIDDLIFQLKYICMEPMLKTMEEIESNVNKLMNALPSDVYVYAKSDVAAEGGILSDLLSIDVQKEDDDLPTEESSIDRDSFDEFLDDNSSTEASEETDPLDFNERNHEHEVFVPFDAIIEESSEDESTERNEEYDNKDSDQRFSISDALSASQATIDGLLDALEGSGDTMDLLQATLQQNDDDAVKSQVIFDNEADAAQKILDAQDEVSERNKSTGKADPHYDNKATDSDTDVDTKGDNVTGDVSNEELAEVADATARQNALLDGHQEKLFDRLHHFFQVRKKVEFRMKRIDPAGKLKEIELVAHSNGIREADGSYKALYQQQNVDGKVASNLGEVYAGAKQAQSSFMDLVYDICSKVKGFEHFDAYFPPLKPLDRASEKARSDYSHRSPGPSETWLYDVLRATITCKTVRQMESINKYLSKKVHIVQAKNRFVTPAYTGYRDLLYHARVPYEFKENVYFIAEIQVQHKEVISVQKLLGLNAHQLYFRSCFSGPERSMEKTLKSLESLDKARKVDEKFVKALLKSEDADQLAMFAQLFHEKLECFDEALELYSRILVLEKSNVGETHAKTAAIYQNIGLVQGKEGDFDSAMMNLQKALDIQEVVFGRNHPEGATTRSHLGHVLCLRGDETGSLQHRSALQQHRISLAIREESLGPDHVDVATSYQNIGLSLGQLGDLEGSLTAYRKALTILQNALEPSHPNVANTHSMIGTVLCGQERFDKATKEFTRALEIRTEKLGKNHPATADSHTEIGDMLCETGDYDDAEWRYREALRIRRALLGKDHPDCATSLSNIGYVLSQKGDYEGALKEHRQALGIRDAILGKRNPDSLSSRHSIKAAMDREQEV
jgi:tetratricopeptide (TPR) repeat protein